MYQMFHRDFYSSYKIQRWLLYDVESQPFIQYVISIRLWIVCLGYLGAQTEEVFCC